MTAWLHRAEVLSDDARLTSVWRLSVSHQIAMVENAGLENAGPICKGLHSTGGLQNAGNDTVWNTVYSLCLFSPAGYDHWVRLKGAAVAPSACLIVDNPTVSLATSNASGSTNLPSARHGCRCATNRRAQTTRWTGKFPRSFATTCTGGSPLTLTLHVPLSPAARHRGRRDRYRTTELWNVNTSFKETDQLDQRSFYLGLVITFFSWFKESMLLTALQTLSWFSDQRWTENRYYIFQQTKLGRCAQVYLVTVYQLDKVTDRNTA